MRLSLRLVIGILAAGALTAGVWAHPANVPVAKVTVSPDGKYDLRMTFDVLAFLLDQTPTVALDPPMNALLRLDERALQKRLEDAKFRFLEGFSVAKGKFKVERIDFPDAKELLRAGGDEKGRVLPLMLTARVTGRLDAGERKTGFRFNEILGTVVLTTEFPYQEPYSEPVEPGAESEPLAIPSPDDVIRSAASMKHQDRPSKPVEVPPAAEVRLAIQSRYQAWSQAYMAHDVDQLLSMLAPDYSLKTAKGQVITRSQYEVMLNLRKQKHSDTTRYSTEILRMTLNEGVAAIYSRETTTDPTKNGANGKVEPATYQHDYLDVWVFKGGQWLLRSTTTQREVVVPSG